MSLIGCLRIVFDYLEHDPKFENASSAQIDSLVSSLSTELNLAYEKMLETSSDVRLAKFPFHIILGAHEPLDLAVLRHFLSIIVSKWTFPPFHEDQSDDIFVKIIRSSCGLMVIWINNMVQLFHRTAHDFLLSTDPIPRDLRSSPLSFKGSFHVMESNMWLELLCVSVIHERYRSANSLRDPIGKYACRYWMLHYSYGRFALGHKPSTRKLGNTVISVRSTKHRSSEEMDLIVQRMEIGTLNAYYLRAYNLSELHSDIFWQWYLVSGVTPEQLQSDWDVWLILLAAEARCCVFAPEGLDVLLLDKNRLPTLACSESEHPTCLMAIRYVVDDRNKFDKVFRAYCGSIYQNKRDRETTKQAMKSPEGPTLPGKVQALDKSHILQDRETTPANAGTDDDVTPLVSLTEMENVYIPHDQAASHIALMEAVEYEDLQNVRVLLKHGASPDAIGPCRCGSEGHYAVVLHTAAKKGNAEILQALLGAGADANMGDHNNDTALTWAAQMGHVNCLEILLGVDGIEVNAVDNDGDSALLCAVFGGKTETTRMLLAREDVDREVRNKLGYTAEDLAKTKTEQLRELFVGSFGKVQGTRR